MTRPEQVVRLRTRPVFEPECRAVDLEYARVGFDERAHRQWFGAGVADRMVSDLTGG